MKEEKQRTINLFTLEEWVEYTKYIDSHNAEQWEKCEEINKELRQKHEEGVEKRKRAWVNVTGSEFGFWPGFPGRVSPFTKTASIEGCLNWLAEKYGKAENHLTKQSTS